MLEYENYGYGHEPEPTIFPTPMRRRPTRHRYDYPDEVRGAYEDAVAALNHNLPKLCSVGIGMLIESACQERSASSIDELVKQGLLGAVQAKFLNLMRRTRNETAHTRTAPTTDELDQALEFIESLLGVIYVLPGVQESLEKAHTERSGCHAATVPAAPEVTEKGRPAATGEGAPAPTQN
jgi:hypothetical protein